MVGSVIENRLDTYNRISGHRTGTHRVRDTLLDSREEVLGDSTADDNLLEYIRSVEVSRRLELHLDMSVLAMSAGLLLILGIDIAVLADSLAERDSRLAELRLNLVLGLELADDDIKMLVSHTVQKRLMVAGIIDGLHRQVFLSDLSQSLGDLVEIPLVLRRVLLVCVRSRNIKLIEEDRRCLG